MRNCQRSVAFVSRTRPTGSSILRTSTKCYKGERLLRCSPFLVLQNQRPSLPFQHRHPSKCL
jgi:hypothetical protein